MGDHISGLGVFLAVNSGMETDLCVCWHNLSITSMADTPFITSSVRSNWEFNGIGLSFFTIKGLMGSFDNAVSLVLGYLSHLRHKFDVCRKS